MSIEIVVKETNYCLGATWGKIKVLKNAPFEGNRIRLQKKDSFNKYLKRKWVPFICKS